ncbi:hypothetical protein Lal_00013515 [Lupinus albus]|nr:hypothetical protein Lal_00013515 [Lupinus albus]
MGEMVDVEDEYAFYCKIEDEYVNNNDACKETEKELMATKVKPSVHKMGFSIDPIDRRTYKPRTDRPTAPTAQLEPTIPNPPGSYTQSSSFDVLPSNQMIMDELVSL